MKKSSDKHVEVDLGAAGILVLTYRRPLTPEQRRNVKRAMEQVARSEGPITIVLEDGCKHSIIRREPVVTQVAVNVMGPTKSQCAARVSHIVRRAALGYR